MRKILLIFGDHKKLATIGPPSATEPDKDLLLERARNLFLDGNGEAKVIIQEYVVDFEDWIDIKNDFVAEDKQKIKVILSVSQCEHYIKLSKPLVLSLLCTFHYLL